MARRKTKKTKARRPSSKRKSPARAKRRPAKRARRNPTPLLLLPLANPVVTTKAGRRLKIDSRNKTKASRLLNARKKAKKAHKKMPYSVAQRGGKRLTTPEAMLTLQRAGQTSRKRKGGKRKSTGRKAPARKSGGGSRAVGRDTLSVTTTLLRP